MKKEMNYTIEFYRFMFAVNFVIIHALMVIPIGYLKGFPIFLSALDIIIPFMAFSGYFMMRGFKKSQASGELSEKGASKIAWEYLKKRLIALFPLVLLGNTLGFIATNIWMGTPLKDIPIHLINAAGEFFGLYIAGIGFGNPSVGMWGEGVRVLQCLNTPMWFMSGIFVVGYFVYYLLAKNEKLYASFIAPLAIILFYGSNYQLTSVPMWYDIHSYGSFNVAMGMPLMFVGFSIGILLWYPIDALKNHEWTKGEKTLLTIVQIFLTFFVFERTWVSLTSPMGQYFNVGWVNVHLLSIVFSFLVLLNVDGCTRFPLFSSKIWKIPGRLALYIYSIHFPVLVFTALAMGLKGTILSPETAAAVVPRLIMMCGIGIVASIGLGYLVMVIDQKHVQPWLKKKFS